MRLAKLTLAGFKSFADPTEFTFDEPIVGIVGPNGCGKSNVVDAIRWVLGERSSKSLRGKEMTDVIFAGSAGRPPAGMASVTLTFENPVLDGPTSGPAADGAGPTRIAADQDDAPGPDEDEPSDVVLDRAMKVRRALPIDADTVEIERRLYRDGTSRYLINGRRGRLRDIRELFLDTGVGADAYSIIEQGKVDAMLLAGPQERRAIFEEAAGVARYKVRRIEAQRKLERAVANLALTRQQLEATERRLRLVKGQAAKARRFRDLDAELRALRLAVAFDQYDDIRRRLEGLTSRLTELEEARRRAHEDVAALERALQEAEVRRHELFARHKAAEEQRLAATHARDSAIQRREMTQQALAEARAQAEADERRLADADGRLADLTRASVAQGEQVAALAERLADADRAVESAGQQRAEGLRALGEADAGLARRQAALSDIERDRAALAASIEADRRRADAMREELQRLAERISALDEERVRLDEARRNADEALAAAGAGAAEVEAERLELERAGDSLVRDRTGIALRLRGLEQEHLRADSRRQTLREMIEAGVGLGEAARAVIERRDAGGCFAGVIAPLAELIRTDGAHAVAVAAALGDDLRALIVPNTASAPAPAELASLTGRVAFLPLSPGVTAGETAPAPSAPVPLRSVVEPRALEDRGATAPAIAELLDRLLASVYLVGSLDEAWRLAAASPHARFVTPDGAVVGPDGRVTAGPPGADDAAGFLQRRAELAQLDESLARSGAELASLRSALADADEHAAELGRRQGALRDRVAEAHRVLADRRALVEQFAARAERLERDRRDLHDQMQEHGSRLSWLDGDLEQREERSGALSRLRDDEAAAAEALRADRAFAQARADALGEAVTAARIEAGRLAEQVAAARKEHRRLAVELEAGESQRRDLAALVEQSVQRVMEHERSIAQAAAQIERAAADAVQFADMARGLSGAVAGAIDAAEELSERTAAARLHAQGVERDWHALEVSRRETEVKREAMEDRATEELGIDLAFEYADYRAMTADGVVARLDPARAARDIEALRGEIARLGAVNLDAIEEESQLARRNEDLARQVADIDDAARKLADLIERLNAASRERFGRVFESIRAHFAGEDGMFRRLFGGGKAEVRLMPLVREVETPQGVQRVETDEVDLLESGIEIVAKPPGKEPRSISQLSGGEKTLTAVALLLAIFRSKPSCFCVLDEVDAALDDANVERFCDVVRRFTAHSHFIVITHNKKTMQAADRLFGVTMQERGVSTRVSVKIEQAEPEGRAPIAGGQVLESKPRSAGRPTRTHPVAGSAASG